MVSGARVREAAESVVPWARVCDASRCEYDSASLSLCLEVCVVLLESPPPSERSYGRISLRSPDRPRGCDGPADLS